MGPYPYPSPSRIRLRTPTCCSRAGSRLLGGRGLGLALGAPWGVGAAPGRGAHLTVVAKMYVPGEGMGGEAPEMKGSRQLNRLFTYISIRIVQAQMEGVGNDGGFAPQATGSRGETQSPDLWDLFNCLEEVPLADGDEWLGEMLKRNPPLALRITDVRRAYLADFDWQELKALTEESILTGGQKVMAQHLGSMPTLGEDGGGAPGGAQEGAGR